MAGSLYILSFFAGILTILAPCVLPILPVILGSSLHHNNLKRALIITGSFVVSVILFTFLLKATTIFIGLGTDFWATISGVILLLFGIFMLFPALREKIAHVVRLDKSNTMASKAKKKGGVRGHILLGLSLGPIFSSCSPTYAVILAIVLPQSFADGVISIVLYALGIGLMLFLIARLGIRLIKKLRWAADPDGRFKKILAGIVILAGLAVLTGYDKELEASLLDAGYINTTHFENGLIDTYLEE